MEEKSCCLRDTKQGEHDFFLTFGKSRWLRSLLRQCEPINTSIARPNSRLGYLEVDSSYRPIGPISLEPNVLVLGAEEGVLREESNK